MMLKNISKFIFFLILSLSLVSCDHWGEDVRGYTGDYRYYAGISEFFECKERVKYYVADMGIAAELEKEYLALGLAKKEDVYTKVEGYFKEEVQMEGIDSIMVFVPTKLISFDQERGCEKGLINR